MVNKTINNNTELITYDLDYFIRELKATASAIELSTDFNEVNSNQFSVIVKLTGKRIFADKSYLKFNGRQYDSNKILNILDIYITISIQYNKMMNINIFLSLLNIDNTVLTYDGTDGLNAIYLILNKKIQDADNERVKANATDSKIPVLNLAFNNYVHAWNGTIKSNEVNAVVKSLEDIKRERLETSTTDGQNQ